MNPNNIISSGDTNDAATPKKQPIISSGSTPEAERPANLLAVALLAIIILGSLIYWFFFLRQPNIPDNNPETDGVSDSRIYNSDNQLAALRMYCHDRESDANYEFYSSGRYELYNDTTYTSDGTYTITPVEGSETDYTFTLAPTKKPRSTTTAIYKSDGDLYFDDAVFPCLEYPNEDNDEEYFDEDEDYDIWDDSDDDEDYDDEEEE